MRIARNPEKPEFLQFNLNKTSGFEILGKTTWNLKKNH